MSIHELKKVYKYNVEKKTQAKYLNNLKVCLKTYEKSVDDNTTVANITKPNYLYLNTLI